jgi:hypothetical protein
MLDPAVGGTIQQKLAAKWLRSFHRASSPARGIINFLSELRASSEAGGDNFTISVLTD